MKFFLGEARNENVYIYTSFIIIFQNLSFNFNVIA